jgi:HD-GYP domain-containing protein (c-di-GMP phosphodiesterase class II)
MANHDRGSPTGRPDVLLLTAADPALDGSGRDPVLAALGLAGEEYLRAQETWAVEAAAVVAARDEASRAREEAVRLRAAHSELEARLAREQREAARARERARLLAEGLKEIHRAAFGGNVFDLILRCCLGVTGATRGLYVTVRGDRLRVRAAVEVDGYPADPPSPFVAALCRRVLTDRDTFLCNEPECPDELPRPARQGEQFANLLAAPVVLMDDLSGVVIVGDKLTGDFDEADADTVLGVGDQAMVAVRNRHLQRELEGAYLSVVGVLADAVEAKDPYTSGHCTLVAQYSRQTAIRLGLDDPDRAATFYGGLLHDVGKIGVSDGVLNKPGKLLPEEWELMRSHARIGRDLLARVPALARVADVVLHHHEGYDGKGYPDGLRGDQIALAARIVCVADAYCAMTSKRSYKESVDPQAARAELVRCRGTQFDPAVVDAFLAVLDDPPESDPADDGLSDPLTADFRLLLDAEAGHR